MTAQWLFDGSIIDNAVIITTLNQSILYLSEVALSDSGNYTCLLNNGIVESVEATGLLIIGKYMFKSIHKVVDSHTFCY